MVYGLVLAASRPPQLLSCAFDARIAGHTPVCRHAVRWCAMPSCSQSHIRNKMAHHLDLRCVSRWDPSTDRYLWCRGSQPKHVSNPGSVITGLILLCVWCVSCRSDTCMASSCISTVFCASWSAISSSSRLFVACPRVRALI